MEFVLLALFSPVLAYYGFDIISTFKEYRLKDLNDIKRVPDIINPYGTVNLDGVKNLELKRYIDNFSNVVESNFNHDDLDNFFYNINTYKCDEEIKRKKLFYLMRVIASYNTDINEIEFGVGDYRTCINHELFHMASSKKGELYSSSGFNFIDDKSKYKSVGVGINEGYTQLLAEKYFDEKDFVSNAYQYMVFVSSYLEKIVGKEKMQSLYMRSDLLGLIDELKKYRTEENVMRFLTDTDFLVKNFPLFEANYVPTKEKKIQLSIYRIDEFLIEIYSMINGFNNYKKEELANGVFKETNELLPKTYRRKIY